MKIASMTSKRRSIIWRNFAKLMALIMLLIGLLALFVFRYASDTIHREFRSANQREAVNAAAALEGAFRQAKRVAAYLSVDTQSRFFFAGVSTRLFTQMDDTILSSQRFAAYAIPWIDSVYLYAPYTGQVIGVDRRYPLAEFTDADWASLMDETPPGGWGMRIRAANDLYPFVLTLLKRDDTHTREGVVVLNMNLRRIMDVIQRGDGTYQRVYWISGDGQVIARSGKQSLLEPLSVAPELAHFSRTRETQAILNADAEAPYAYAQVYMPEYDYYMVSITNLTDYAARMSAMRALLVAAISVMLLCGVGIALYFSLSAFGPVQRLAGLFDDPSYRQGEKRSGDEINRLADRIVQNIQTNQSLRKALDERTDLFNRTQMRALQAQINPHFLFNTLNMITVSAASVLGDDHPAPQMTVWLARLLRYSLESADLVSVLTEMKFAKMYTALLEKRYGSLFTAKWELESGIEDALMPKLLLQPLIENAVYHGISPREDGGTLRISAGTEAGAKIRILRLAVVDDGVGIPPEGLAALRDAVRRPGVLPDEHIGVVNVAERLRLLYLTDYQFDIESAPGEGTRIVVRIPLRFADDDQPRGDAG